MTCFSIICAVLVSASCFSNSTFPHARAVLSSSLNPVCADCEDAGKSASSSERQQRWNAISCGQISVSHRFPLTTEGGFSQCCTSAVPCHAPSLAVPLVYPGAFSSSSLIPCAAWQPPYHCVGTDWCCLQWTPCGGQTSCAQLCLKSYRVMCRKTRVRVGDFNRLFTNCSRPASAWPWKSLWG